jgi:hypothetical protein
MKSILDNARSHIERLLAQIRADRSDDDGLMVIWIEDAEEAMVVCDLDGQAREICLPFVRSEVDYAVALHEIGHIRGRYQDSVRSMIRERWAWEWARRNTIAWTPAMERYALEALKEAQARENEWREELSNLETRLDKNG